MNRLILVRHGRTPGNHEDRFIATTDLALDEVGEAQARTIGASLDSGVVSHVISSPLARARTTATIIAEGAQLARPVVIDARLVELGMGEFEGRTAAEIESIGLAPTFEAWRQGTPASFPDGAESFEVAAKRAASFFADLPKPSQEGTVVVVGHSHLLRILIAVCVFGVNPAIHRRLKLENGRAGVVEWELGAPRLVALNVEQVPTEVSS